MSVKQRPDGKWRARYRDETGREHSKHFKTKGEGARWLVEQKAAMATGQWASPAAGKIAWDEWVDRWLEMQVWAEGSVTAAKTAVYSVPWRQKSIRDVKSGEVQLWVTREAERGLAPSTLRTRLNYVQMAFRAAVDNQVIPRSPALRVKSPRQRKRDKVAKVLTAEQVKASLDAAGDFRAFIAVCAFAGLRLGEAAGLQARDIDFERGVIAVQRQVQGSSIPTTKVVPPKAGSEREVFVPGELLAMLRERAGGPAESFLFRTSLGHLYNRNSAGDAWRRIRDAIGLDSDVTLHTFRHTFASNLIASGCDVVTVQRALGHAQPSITLDVYSHLWPSAEDKTRSATATFMGAVLGNAD